MSSHFERIGQVLTNSADAALSSATVVPWLGAILLETQSTSAEGVSTSNFLRFWQDQLPDSWRTYATLDTLEVCYFSHQCLCITINAYRVNSQSRLEVGSYSMRAEEMLQRAPPLLKAMGRILENGTRNSKTRDDRYCIHAIECCSTETTTAIDALIVALLCHYLVPAPLAGVFFSAPSILLIEQPLHFGMFTRITMPS